MNASGSRLSGLTRDLLQKWHETRTNWRDAKAAEFERVFLGDLIGTVERTVTTIEQVDKLINKIKRDCE
jgi:hypothetical protein